MSRFSISNGAAQRFLLVLPAIDSRLLCPNKVLFDRPAIKSNCRARSDPVSCLLTRAAAPGQLMIALTINYHLNNVLLLRLSLSLSIYRLTQMFSSTACLAHYSSTRALSSSCPGNPPLAIYINRPAACPLVQIDYARPIRTRVVSQRHLQHR